MTGEAATGEPAISYTYDDYNNRATMTIAGGAVTTYTYDENNRLVTETKVLGDVTETTRYGYDYNGNMIYKGTETLEPSGGSGESIAMYISGEDAGSENVTLNEYDGFNRLIKTTVGDKTITYAYNADGLRISKTVNGDTTKYAWSGNQVVMELDGEGAVTAKYVRGVNPISSSDGADSNVKYYLYNGHGDVVQLTGTDGNVSKEYSYDAFGNEKNPDAADTNPFRYCGEYFDKETGTYYLRARYYDPVIGRFISEDSYRGQDNDPLSLNLYTYCANNPVIYIDSSGNSYALVWKENAGWLPLVDAYLPIGDAIYYTGLGICYVADYAPAAWDWMNNTAAPWLNDAMGDVGNWIAKAADNTKEAGKKAVNWVKEKLGGGSSTGDPGKDPNSLKKGMDNIRVLKETKIKGYTVSVDLERGGSNLINIHVKVDNVKYFFNEKLGTFLNEAGQKLPSSLKENQQIIDALKKAQKLIEQGF